MPRFSVILPLAGLLLTAACGDNDTERAATGAVGGAVVAGPPGALVGGAAGTLID
ncbi:hypothetical protein LAZ40_15115 [Cereibacter sphaeroides]|uniref:hypothetical protein n=1 Tax=Rhodobacterales TaxID=204455 RepID=UPI000BBE199C|nr:MULTISPECIES: hypothetical protein [Paracoccaceae]MCE6953372.1 hypothetical protein [Cereibacter sphaeroides]MCE6960353.1 hypothetical protein [Cereibacter sphaeroides]MCE6969302.1 hypothetical protein [Cereibacter sphaeroides]MCE6975361.1 hypothetical protein [Cereibacter sphaeroides]